MSNQKAFTFSHNEESFNATLKVLSNNYVLTIDAMPGLVFKVSQDDRDETVSVILPTDKKGAKPRITTSLKETPILRDALERGLYLN